MYFYMQLYIYVDIHTHPYNILTSLFNATFTLSESAEAEHFLGSSAFLHIDCDDCGRHNLTQCFGNVPLPNFYLKYAMDCTIKTKQENK